MTHDVKPAVLTLDIGSSSCRALLFGFDGKQVEGAQSQISYRARTTEDGGWEMDADELVAVAVRAIDQVRAKSGGVRVAAVAVDTFWHSLVGVSVDGRAATPVLHPFDSRSAAAARELQGRIDNLAQHARTGCMLHPSYPPAKLLWLSQSQPDTFGAAKRWMSIGEYLFLKLLGKAAASTSMVSASGLWDQNENRYDEELLAALPVEREQFAAAEDLDGPVTALTSEYAGRWPELNGIPWYPALGDGACDNIGSGCTQEDNWALMVGTSGAMRATFERTRIEIPKGLFCYRVDRRRFVAGGALSNGGAVYAWMKRNLRLGDDDAETEKQLAAMAPGLHGITMLPLFAGERSPEWRMDARGAMSGLGSSTTAIEILHAALESVALRFRNVYEIMGQAFGAPRVLTGSGSGLLHSPVWTQMMSDTLCHTVTLCTEKEATSRGAALLALERLGAIENASALQPELGATVTPDESRNAIYGAALAKQRELYCRLFEDKQ